MYVVHSVPADSPLSPVASATTAAAVPGPLTRRSRRRWRGGARGFGLGLTLAALALSLGVTGCRRTGTAASVANGPASEATATAVLPPTSDLPASTTIADYWYNYGAELSRYELAQSRYGSIHSGDAVLIFVTEPFDTVQQVKADDPTSPHAVPILKLNVSKTFNTGVYRYSMMESVFSPLDQSAWPQPLKVTVSSQEWCGHTFTQLNRTTDGGYRARQFSYFQSEGDTDAMLPAGTQTEAGIWTRIRLDPASLPLGDVQLVPDSLYLRLAHRLIAAQAATATLAAVTGQTGMKGEALQAYTLTYPELRRTLTIRFQRDFPHVIEGWEETYPGLPGKSGKSELLTTRATRTHSMMLPYWSRHNPGDRALRLRLGLPENE